jgi:hypothetical protein
VFLVSGRDPHMLNLDRLRLAGSSCEEIFYHGAWSGGEAMVTRGFYGTPRWILAQTWQERVVVWMELLKLVKL